MADTDPERGLASERTDLAWTRSGLAVAVCIAALLRHLWPLGERDRLVAMACISLGAVAWAATSMVGRLGSTQAGHGRARLTCRKAGMMTIGTLALALAGLVLAFFPPT